MKRILIAAAACLALTGCAFIEKHLPLVHPRAHPAPITHPTPPFLTKQQEHDIKGLLDHAIDTTACIDPANANDPKCAKK